MKNASKTAMGAMVAALCIALMLLTAVIPFLSYAMPMIAGALITVMVIECDKLWALFVYVSVSILSLLVVPDKSAGLAFLFYFGYYPILKNILESKFNKTAETIIKYANIIFVVLGAYFLALKFFGIDTDDMEFIVPHLGKWYTYLILSLLTAIFFKLYDTALSKAILLYERVFRKKFRKLFK